MAQGISVLDFPNEPTPDPAHFVHVFGSDGVRDVKTPLNQLPVSSAAQALFDNRLPLSGSTELTAPQKASLAAQWPEAAESHIPVLANLKIPVQGYGNSTIHPDVIRVEGGWQGYEYWMAHTSGYPTSFAVGGSNFEGPAVCASNDLANWVILPGAQAELDQKRIDMSASAPGGGDYGHFADPCILKTQAGNLRVYCIAGKDGAPIRHSLLGFESSDGKTWDLLGTDGHLVQTLLAHDLTSPCVIQLADASYEMFTARTGGGQPYSLLRWTSPDGEDWSTSPTVCSLPAGANVWHVDVELVGGVYHALCTQRSTDYAAYNATYMTSTDGDTWTGDVTKPIHARAMIDEPSSIAGGGYYRPSMIPRENGNFDLILCTLEILGWGDGRHDVSNNVHRKSNISLARDVNLTKQHFWDWITASDNAQILHQVGYPQIHHDRHVVEGINEDETNGKGWEFHYSTPKIGIASGASVKISDGNKPMMNPGTNFTLSRAQGRFEISGVLNSTPAALIAITGSSAVVYLVEAVSGKIVISPPIEWVITVTPTPDNLPATHEGEAIVGVTSGAVGVLNRATESGRVLYPKNMSTVANFESGEQITIGGVTLTASGTPVTVNGFARAPGDDGINIIFVPYVAGSGDGGYFELWNNSAAIFHGNVRYSAHR
jgi:hypothetical protein